ncbi:MAG: hypothetical protein IJR66_00460 [Clostridia bacterium]|nr:hypothetical protein [Clostridia bacterium]
MDVKIFPKKLDGVIEAVSNKSFANRVILASALSSSPTEIYLKTMTEDVKSLISSIKSLGISVRENKNTITLSPTDCYEQDKEIEFFGSSSAIKFMLPFLSSLDISPTIVSENKPIKINVDNVFNLKGVGTTADITPFSLIGALHGGIYRASDFSGSFFISSLLMVLPTLKEDSTFVCNKSFKNKEYAKITLKIMRDFGIIIEDREDGFFIPNSQRYVSPDKISVEGDYFACSFISGANAFGNRVRITGLDGDSVQNNKTIKDYLLKFNAKGTNIELKDDYDFIYILSAVSLFTCSDTTLSFNPVKDKELSLLNSFVNNLNKLGGQVELYDNRIVIKGKGGINGGAIVDSFGDGRQAICYSLIATCADNPITVLSADSANKVYSFFYNDFKLLGGICQVL